jgi:hypothetical protein
MAFRYHWGLERPRTHRESLERQKAGITLAQLKLAADFWESMRQLDKRLADLDAEIAMIDFMTPGGRYSSARAAEWQARNAPATETPAKRKPGRPRIYPPGSPRPLRKSRAKTRAGLIRAAGRGVRTLDTPPQN